MATTQKKFCLSSSKVELKRQADELIDLIAYMKQVIDLEEFSALAAIQVGVPLRLIVMSSGHSLVNPRIAAESLMRSNCSVDYPDWMIKTMRLEFPTSVTVEHDINGYTSSQTTFVGDGACAVYAIIKHVLEA